MINLLIYLFIGIIVGVIIHLFDLHKHSLGQTITTSVIAALVSGVFAYYYLDNAQYTVSISSILLVTSLSFFATLVWKVVYQPPKNHTDEYNQWVDENNLLPSRYQYAVYSDIRTQPKKQKQIESLFKNLDYPISKRDLISYAESHNVSAQTLTTLENLPDHIYNSWDEVKVLV